MMKKVITIVGPTASGKTSLSLKIAKKLNLEIINGDSVQVYQELNIGSAKIKKEDMMGIKHHMLSIRPLSMPFSVFDYQKMARAIIEKTNNHMIVVGGTGLYTKALLFNYEFSEETNRIDLEERYKEVSIEDLKKRILEIKPTLSLLESNRRRLIRTLYLLETNQFISEKKGNTPYYDSLIIYLDLDKEILKERLMMRLDQMIEEGFIEEVRGLNEHSLNIVGYREIQSYLKGDMTLEEAKNRIIQVSMKLAKKQKTWFKNQMPVHILNALSPTVEKDAFTLIEQFLRGDT